MLLAPHILVGAAVASQFQNPVLGLIFALLSHFVLDRTPHWEYSVEALKQIKTRGIKYCRPILLRVILDIIIGFAVLIFAMLISANPIDFVYLALGGFFGILPDGLSFLLFVKEKSRGRLVSFLKIFYALHRRIHFKKEKGLPPLRIGLSTQAIAILLALYFIIF